jgi:hypothetical protein
VFLDYLDRTAHLAGPPPTGPNAAAAMLQNRLRAAAAARGTDAGRIASRVVEIALGRAAMRPPPIYVVGLGGSGSHWLTGMLAEALPAIDVEEAPAPRDFLAAIEPLRASDQGVAIDCLHLCHAHALRPEAPAEAFAAARIVNSAPLVTERRYREWDPGCAFVHLIRDPRDQAMCLAFRKGFKRWVSPGASDEEFLVQCVELNARHNAEMHDPPVPPDHVCRYEELKASPAGTLLRLAAAIGERVEPGAAEAAARAFDARSMRSGTISRRGTLAGSESRGWEEEADARRRLILHAHLAEAVTAMRYPADECLGRALDPGPLRGPRRLPFAREGGLGVLFARGDGGRAGWTRLGEARGELEVEAGLELKLRVHERAAADSIGALGALPPDGLDALCLAGNAALDDELLGVCAESLPGLRTLDLARTAVTDRGAARIARLRELSGVGVFGAALSAEGVAGLRAALPPGAVVGEA